VLPPAVSVLSVVKPPVLCVVLASRLFATVRSLRVGLLMVMVAHRWTVRKPDYCVAEVWDA
jgi:hypothetical protein